jgi:hypothetical protein
VSTFSDLTSRCICIIGLQQQQQEEAAHHHHHITIIISSADKNKVARIKDVGVEKEACRSS